MRAINASIMRQVNRKLILNQIRLRPISRAELAEITGLTRASVTQIVEELIGEGIVVETTMIGRTRLGRRSTQLAIEPASGAVFGVNMSRRACSVGVMDMAGTVLAHNAEIVAGRDPADVLDSVAAAILRQKKELELGDGCVRGVGLCVPGPVEARDGRLLNPARHPEWKGLPLVKLLEQRLDMPVWVESTARAQSLAEKYFGVSGESFALIRLDDSVSLGVIVRGELYRGAQDFVAELGGCVLSGDGGQTLNQLISLPALLAGRPYRSWAELMERRGEPEAEAAIERLIRYLAPCVAGLMYVLSIERVVLAGELGAASEGLLPQLNAAVRARVGLQLAADPVRTETRLDPVRIGAAPAFAAFFDAN